MDALDSDDRLLRTRTGKTATRDIVQFVPFRSFKHRHYSELARATLAGTFISMIDYQHFAHVWLSCRATQTAH